MIDSARLGGTGALSNLLGYKDPQIFDFSLIGYLGGSGFFPRLDFNGMDPKPEHEVRSVSFASYLRLVRENRNFRRLWMAQIVSEIGDWFYTLAIYSLLLQLTGHASSVALALVLQVLPQTFIGPIAGVVNDRIRRKRVMIAADLVRVVIVLAMLLVRSREMVLLVYPLLLMETLMAAFFEPARSAVIPNITKREDVIVANTLGSTTWSMNLVLGATLGGIVGALLGRDAVFVLNALSFLVSALFIAGMQFAEPVARAGFVRLHARARRCALRARPSLAAGDGFRQSRQSGDRSELGSVHGDGSEVLSCALAPSGSAARRDARHEHAARGSWSGRAHRTAVQRALGRTSGTPFASRHLLRIPGDGPWLHADRQVWHGLVRVLVGRGRALRRLNRLGVLNHALAVAHRRPISRARVFGRPGIVHADHRHWRVCVWEVFGWRLLRAHAGDCNRIGYAASGCDLGLGDEVVEAESGARNGNRGLTFARSGSVARLGIELINLCGHDEVAFRQAVDLVRPECDFGLAPGEKDVRMMTLIFGHFADAVHEIQRLLEIGKLEGSCEVMFVDDFPVRQLMAQVMQSRAFESGNIAAAWNAGPFGKSGHGRTPPLNRSYA
jgi:hypothetical protein